MPRSHANHQMAAGWPTGFDIERHGLASGKDVRVMNPPDCVVMRQFGERQAFHIIHN